MATEEGSCFSTQAGGCRVRMWTEYHQIIWVFKRSQMSEFVCRTYKCQQQTCVLKNSVRVKQNLPVSDLWSWAGVGRAVRKGLILQVAGDKEMGVNERRARQEEELRRVQGSRTGHRRRWALPREAPRRAREWPSTPRKWEEWPLLFRIKVSYAMPSSSHSGRPHLPQALTGFVMAPGLPAKHPHASGPQV